MIGRYTIPVFVVPADKSWDTTAVAAGLPGPRLGQRLFEADGLVVLPK